jgi:hypothetical protein
VTDISPAPALAFIDGEHTRRAVLSDFDFCRRVVRPDGTIVFHDYWIISSAVDEIRAQLNIAGIGHTGVQMDGSVYALFLKPALVANDPHIATIHARNQRRERRQRIRRTVNQLVPAPIWNLMRSIKRSLSRPRS